MSKRSFTQTQALGCSWGWLAESIVKRHLHYALRDEDSVAAVSGNTWQAQASAGANVFPARENSAADAAVLILPEPPKARPAGLGNDPTETWRWLQDAEDPQFLYFDVKGSLAWTPEQFPVAFLLLCRPRNPEYFFLLPYLDAGVIGQQLTDINIASIAQYAIHVSNLREAILNLIAASRGGGKFMNPSNGTQYHSWPVPAASIGLGPLARLGPLCRVSEAKILELMGLLERHLKGKAKLTYNPSHPFVCDLIWDNTTSQGGRDGEGNADFLLIEHKAGQSNVETALAPKFNWHFLVSHRDDVLTVIARGTKKINWNGPDAPGTFSLDAHRASKQRWDELRSFVIRETPRVKRSLRRKWRNAAVFDDSGEYRPRAPRDGDEEKEEQASTKESAECAEAVMTINKQFCALGRHVIHPLTGRHPSGEYVVVRHAWSPEERSAFAKTRALPDVLLKKGDSASGRSNILVRGVVRAKGNHAERLAWWEQQNEHQSIVAYHPECVRLPWLWMFVDDGACTFYEAAGGFCAKCSDPPSVRQFTARRTGRRHPLEQVAAGAFPEMRNIDDGSVAFFLDEALEDPRRAGWRVDLFGDAGVHQSAQNHGFAKFARVLSEKSKFIHEVVRAQHAGAAARFDDLISALAGGIDPRDRVCCDHCRDNASCLFEIAPGDFQTLRCQRCEQAGQKFCDFDWLSAAVVQSLKSSEAFRQHVPCQRCFKRGIRCDNQTNGCGPCRDASRPCHRKACEAFHLPRGVECRLPCDQAHAGDGYAAQSLTPEERPAGTNQGRIDEADQENRKRVAICKRCVDKGWAGNSHKDVKRLWGGRGGRHLCDNGGSSGSCHLCERDGTTCVRIKCKDFEDCTDKECHFAHKDQGFQHLIAHRPVQQHVRQELVAGHGERKGVFKVIANRRPENWSTIEKSYYSLGSGKK